MSGALTPIEVFCSYAHEDEPYLDRLHVHLTMLRREGLISAWHDRRIFPGEDWTKALDQHLNTASVILLLVSPDFIASDYCYNIEMQRALQRHEAGEACVIPIVIRPCEWNKTPIARLQCLPRNCKPVTKWDDQDDAWNDVTGGIRKNIEDFAIRSRTPIAPNPTLILPPSSGPLSIPEGQEGLSIPTPPASRNTNNLEPPGGPKTTPRQYLQQLYDFTIVPIKSNITSAIPIFPASLIITAVLLLLLTIFLFFNILDLMVFLISSASHPLSTMK